MNRREVYTKSSRMEKKPGKSDTGHLSITAGRGER
jgi:hypothetical protein